VAVDCESVVLPPAVSEGLVLVDVSVTVGGEDEVGVLSFDTGVEGDSEVCETTELDVIEDVRVAVASVVATVVDVAITVPLVLGPSCLLTNATKLTAPSGEC